MLNSVIFFLAYVHCIVQTSPQFWNTFIILKRNPVLISNQSQFSPHFIPSVQFTSLSCVQLFATLWTAARQASLPSLTPGTSSNSCLLSRWCHPAMSSSVIPFSSCLQSFPASESFQMSPIFISGGQSIGVSASASVLPMNIQDWFPLVGLVGSPCHPRDSQASSPTPIQKHQFFSIHISSLTSIHDHRKKHSFD